MKQLTFVGAMLAGLSCCALQAQQNVVYHPNNQPTGGANAFPFGAAKNGVRQQILVPGSVLGTTPILIQDIFVAHIAPLGTSASMTDGEIVYKDFEIRLGTTQIATLTNTWATNLPNPTVVQKGRLRMRWKKNTWTPIGIQQPFLWLPLSPSDNLVVDFIFWSLQDAGGITPDVNGYIMTTSAGSAAAGAVQRVYQLNWPVAQPATGSIDASGGTKLGFLLGNGNFVGRGKGCPSSLSTTPATDTAGTWPKLGSSFQLQVSNAGATVPAFPILGSSELTWGAIPLPLDLALAGAPGCMVWTDPLLALPTLVTSAAGAAAIPVAVPNLPGLLGGRLYATWATLDATANPFGIVTSDYGLLILGQ